MNPKVPRINVHRGRFLSQFLQTIPDTTVKTGERLSSVQEVSDAVIITFEDGLVERTHGVIACNGINSAARATVLVSEHPPVKPTYTGRV
jgi:2-polyprenyl-6-methoxyphenol hydroxylase-like FAD-dependent oxidoreductase